MRALSLGKDERERIQKLVERAAKNVVSLTEVKKQAEWGHDRADGAKPPLQVNHEQTIEIPVGYTATYTHEEQPGGVCRHLSVSVSTPRKMPHPAAVEELMAAFGFVNSLTKCVVWVEQITKDEAAINIVEPLDGDTEKLKKEA